MGSVLRWDDQEWPVRPPSPEDWRAFEAFLENECRMVHNPFVEFAEKIKALPERLQDVATAEFVQRPDLFSTFPASVKMAVMMDFPAVSALALFFTGRQIATKEN